METKQLNCNVLLIGKTGVGKSSFANYLFGTEIFTSGKGKPVTDWQHNFQSNYLMVEDIRVTVYDSVGLEADNGVEWSSKLQDFLKKQQNSHEVDKIIHAVFYVINANSARIENCEFEIMQSIAHKFSIPTIVVLTNADIAGKEKLTALEKLLNEHNINFVKVCSVTTQTRVVASKPFGKEKALEFFLAAAYEKVCKDLVIRSLQNAKQFLCRLRNDFEAEIRNADISIFNLENLERTIDAIMQKFDGKFGNITEEDIFQPELNHYKTFLDSFNVNYRGKDVFDESLEKLENIIQEIDSNDSALLRKMESIIEKLEKGDFFEQLRAALSIVPFILNIKDKLIQGCHECFSLFIEKIDKLIKDLRAS